MARLLSNLSLFRLIQMKLSVQLSPKSESGHHQIQNQTELSCGPNTQ